MYRKKHSLYYPWFQASNTIPYVMERILCGKGDIAMYYLGLNTLCTYTLNMTEDFSGREENALCYFRNIA